MTKLKKIFTLDRKSFVLFCINIVVMGLLFSFPLRALCKLTDIHIVYLIILSGLISYIVAKVNQNIKLNSKDINMMEFFYIFSIGMCTTSFFIILGYPLLGLFITGEIGIVIGIVKIKWDNIFNSLYSPFQPEAINIGVGNNDIGTNYLQSENQQGESSSSNSSSEIIPMINKGLKETISDWIKADENVLISLEKLNAMPLTLGSRDIPGGHQTFFNVLEFQGKYLHHHIIKRKVWFRLFTDNIINSANDKLAFAALDKKTNDLIENYFSQVEKLSSMTNVEIALKEFFNRTNEVRNAVYKELNAFERDLDAKVRAESIYTSKEFRHIYNVEYPSVKKKYMDQDSYLRKKVSEVLNAPKQRN